MPTSTFFRLPEEKRQRLTDAAWEEFGRVGFADVSINKIICKAQIPRGSFYQYFSGKEDLFQYLMTGAKEYFINCLTGKMRETGGDLFSVPVEIYDQFLAENSGFGQQASAFVRVLRLNQGMDLHKLLCGETDLLPAVLLEGLNPLRLRRQDPAFLEQLYGLTLFCTATAVITALTQPEKREHERTLLQTRIDILAHGSLRPDLIAREGGTL